MGDEARKRVMVVDDASLARLYLRDILEGAGYQVVEALNGVEALEKLLSAPVDLLIVDINMPQMDGISFLKAVRSLDLPVASTPAMVTSTEAAPQDFAAARAAGANFYLVKPISREKLAAFARILCGSAA